MNYVPNLLIGVFMALSLVGCGGVRAPNPLVLDNIDVQVAEGPKEFKDLQELSRQAGLAKLKGKTNHIRLQAIRDTAMSVSARTALAVRGQAINEMLASQEMHLDNVFN